MPTRTISISEEAYQALKELKEDRDSFSSVILKNLKRNQNLSRYIGKITEEEAEEIKESIRKSRKKSRERYK